MKELFKNYQALLTNIENRIQYLDTLIHQYPKSSDELKELHLRRDTLKEEYDELILSLHDMVKYIDTEKPPVRRVSDVSEAKPAA